MIGLLTVNKQIYNERIIIMGKIVDTIVKHVMESKQLKEKIEKQIVEETEKYCHEWYKDNHKGNVISEKDFTENIIQSIRVTAKNDTFNVELQPFWSKNTSEESLVYQNFSRDWSDFMRSKV